jgi:shikimate dehydrogenase
LISLPFAASIFDYTNWFVHVSLIGVPSVGTREEQVAGDPTLQRAQGCRDPNIENIAREELSFGAGEKQLRAGLIGRGIQESRTPRMHEAEGARLGLRYHYQLFDFDRLGLPDSELANMVERLRAKGFAGVNVTHPFKERVIAHLDHLAPDAGCIGAVNTVVFGPEGSIGYNTDCWGFAESFRRGLESPRIDRVVLIGAGGAGMAVARALVDLGVGTLLIFDIDGPKALRLSAAIGASAAKAAVISNLDDAIRGADGVVNATPLGMAKYPGLPLDPLILRRDLWVADIVYFPTDTALLRAAKEVGCRTLPGAGMAIFQAVMAFELIAGVTPDPVRMADHFQAGERTLALT